MKQDIQTLEDIKQVVDSFYEQLRAQAVLGPIFEEKIQDNWKAHLDKMYRFWQTILLETRTYSGSPFPPHAQLPIAQQHFDIWIALWHQTVDSFFSGAKAEEMKWRADKMAVLFLHKIEYYQTSGTKPLI